MRWRAPITLCVLVVILLAAAYYGWQTVVSPVTGPDDSTNTPSHHHRHHTPKPHCVETKTYPKGRQFRAGSFAVNVYNAGSVSGRAAEVLASLANNGFKEGVAANPPASVTATNVSILTQTPNAPRVQLLMKQFRGTVRLVPGPELALGMDVVIGPQFEGVNPDAPNSLTLPEATTVCTKFATGGSSH